MKIVKALLGLVVVIAIVIAGSVYYVASNLDGLVAEAIETYGSEVVGAPVRVGSMKILLTEGKGSIYDLSIGNPEGFSSGDAFTLGEVTLGIDLSDPATITEEPYGVSVVRIIAPDVKAELNASGANNIQALQKNVASYTGPSSGETATDTGPAPRIRIGELVFEKANLAADTTAFGGKPLDITLPPLTMKSLGGASGQPADAIAKQVMSAYTGVVIKAITRELAQGSVDSAIDLGGAGGEAVKGALRGLLQ